MADVSVMLMSTSVGGEGGAGEKGRREGGNVYLITQTSQCKERTYWVKVAG